MGEASFNFNDKIVLVTGSAGNIGEKIVMLFAESGAKVVIVDINEEGIKLVSEKCKNASPHKFQPLEIVADLSKDEDLTRLIDTTIKQLGRLDVLVNCAGVGIAESISGERAIEVFDHTIRINLRAPYVLTHLAAPHLSKTSGCIVNVSSVQSTRSLLKFNAYAISKSGIDMMTKTTALELGPKNIRVNSVNPGHIWPPMANPNPAEKTFTEASIEQTREWVEQNYPLRRYGQPEDVAKAIAFLSSNAAQFISGVNLLVESGITTLFPGPNEC